MRLEEGDWEAEVGNVVAFCSPGMHHGNLCSSAISVSPAVTELLGLCFRLNITLNTDLYGVLYSGQVRST